MDTLLTQRDAAIALRLSTRTLERLRVSGLGPRYIKTTRRVLYRECDIEAWLTARVVRSTSEAAGVGGLRHDHQAQTQTYPRRHQANQRSTRSRC